MFRVQSESQAKTVGLRPCECVLTLGNANREGTLHSIPNDIADRGTWIECIDVFVDEEFRRIVPSDVDFTKRLRLSVIAVLEEVCGEALVLRSGGRKVLAGVVGIVSWVSFRTLEEYRGRKDLARYNSRFLSHTAWVEKSGQVLSGVPQEIGSERET